MQKSFTSKAQKALKLAEKASKSLKHNYIGTEHLLLGLIREGSGVAANVLMENGVAADRLLDLIESLIAPSGQTAVADIDGWTPRAEQILENAKREDRDGTYSDCDYERNRMRGFSSDEYVKRKFAEAVCGYIGCNGRRRQSVPGRFYKR